MEIGRKLELEIRGSVRKRVIMEKIVESITIYLKRKHWKTSLREEENMSVTQKELEKAKILARTEIEKAKIEQETRLREMEIRRSNEEDRFEITKQVNLVPKFAEREVEEYLEHFERTALNIEWPKRHWSMLLQTVEEKPRKHIQPYRRRSAPLRNSESGHTKSL